jgi:hypothetical protein
MRKWIISAAVIVVVGFIAYDYFRAGFHTRPEMPEGAFSLSYKNGLRAIMVGVPDVRPERKYLGVPFQVQPWYEKSWSFCSAPSTRSPLVNAPLGSFRLGSYFSVMQYQ